MAGLWFLSGTSPFRFNLISLYIVFLSCTVLGPIVSNYSGIDGYAKLNIALMLHLIAIYIAYIISFYFLPERITKFEVRYQPKSVQKLLLVVSILVTVHMLTESPSLPLVSLLFGESVSAVDVVVAREGVYKLNSSYFTLLWHWNRSIIIPLLLMAYLVNSLQDKKEFRKFVLFFMYAVFVNAMDASLGSVAQLILIIFLVLYYSRVKRIALILLAFIPIFLFPNLSWHVLVRLSTDSYRRVLYYFEYFGNSKDFLYGRTNKLFALITGQDQYSAANFIFRQVVPVRKLEYASTGNMNANSIAYMWADFGYFGVFLITFVFFLIVFYVDKTYKKSKDWLAQFLTILSMLLVLKMTGSNFTSILIGHGFLPLFFIFMLSRKKVHDG